MIRRGRGVPALCASAGDTAAGITRGGASLANRCNAGAISAGPAAVEEAGMSMQPSNSGGTAPSLSLVGAVPPVPDDPLVSIGRGVRPARRPSRVRVSRRAQQGGAMVFPASGGDADRRSPMTGTGRTPLPVAGDGMPMIRESAPTQQCGESSRSPAMSS